MRLHNSYCLLCLGKPNQLNYPDTFLAPLLVHRRLRGPFERTFAAHDGEGLETRLNLGPDYSLITHSISKGGLFKAA